MSLNKKGYSMTYTLVIGSIICILAAIGITIWFNGGTEALAGSLSGISSCENHGGVCASTNSCNDQVRGGKCPNNQICCKDRDVVRAVTSGNRVASLEASSNNQGGYLYVLDQVINDCEISGITKYSFSPQNINNLNSNQQGCVYEKLNEYYLDKFGTTPKFREIANDPECTSHYCKINKILKLVGTTEIKEQCDNPKNSERLNCEYELIILSYNLDEIERSLFRQLCNHLSDSRVTNIQCLVDHSLTFVEKAPKWYLPSSNQNQPDPECVSNSMCSSDDDVDDVCINVNTDGRNRCASCDKFLGLGFDCHPFGPDHGPYNDRFFRSGQGLDLLCCGFHDNNNILEKIGGSVSCPNQQQTYCNAISPTVSRDITSNNPVSDRSLYNGENPETVTPSCMRGTCQDNQEECWEECRQRVISYCDSQHPIGSYSNNNPWYVSRSLCVEELYNRP